MSDQTAPEPLIGPVGPSMLAIGLMSGTSQDGIDVALLDTDGEHIGRFSATACRPYGKTERTLLRRASAAAANLTASQNHSLIWRTQSIVQNLSAGIFPYAK